MIYGNYKPIMESTFIDASDSIIDLEKGTIFYNAVKTADDEVKYNGKTYRSFIDFWEEVTGMSRMDVDFLCSNENCEYGDDIGAYDLEGAHIAPQKPAGALKRGDKFCIVPLCPKCNHPTNQGKMILRYKVRVPVLIWDGK